MKLAAPVSSYTLTRALLTSCSLPAVLIVGCGGSRLASSTICRARFGFPWRMVLALARSSSCEKQ
eukprot:6444105-Amphidinium_carterae.1